MKVVKRIGFFGRAFGTVYALVALGDKPKAIRNN
jgi:hypothetical protein